MRSRLYIQPRKQVRWKGQGQGQHERQRQEQGHAVSCKRVGCGRYSVEGDSVGTGFRSLGNYHRQCYACDVLERSTTRVYFGTRRDHLITYNTRARSGSSSTTTREQLRRHHLRNFWRALRCARWLSPSLRMVRTLPISVAPSFRQWRSLARNARWKDM